MPPESADPGATEMMMSNLPENLGEAFEYLDELRASGKTNMYGVRPYVARAMGYPGGVAGDVLVAWMESFSHEISAADRAAAILAKQDT